ncbi:MAG: hypothetical protein J3R72DRAFT_242437 [Linnemannia gamsii]|nr:MAG: hypothetical protein J3R72DRAFT_242437 [Linnemannia gamsii]
MTSHNIDLHAVDTMLQNTLQLHRQLNRSQSGVTRTPNNPRQQQQPTNPSGLGMGSSLRIESGSRSAYHSGSISTSAQPMDRSFSESSSNGMGSSGPATVVASPPHSSAPGRASHTISPSSPITSAFSSPQIPRLPSSATFASYNDHPQRQDPQPTSALSGITPPKDLPVLSVDTAALPPSTSAITPSVTPYTRSYTKSLSAGTHPHSSPSAQPHTRRIKTSLGGTANIDHNGRLVHHFLAGHDSKDGAATIFVNVRDVAKDLWVRLEIPRNIPVQSARDLILAKCQRTMAPPSAPSSVAETLQVDDESSVPQKQGGRSEQSSEQRPNELNVNELDQDPSKTPTHRSKGNNKSVAYNNIPNSHSNRSTAKSSHSNNSNGSDHHSHGSLDEEDIQLRAEAIITRLDLFVDSINGFGDSAARINYIRPIQVKSQNSTSHNEGQSEPTKSHNLRRLLSNSSMNHDDHSTSPPERQNREGGAGRLGQIPGWSHWRERHNSHTGKTDVHDLGDILIDYPAEGQDYPNEAIQKDCEAWKASFGLFWVAAGHWLDDSRLINSYHLQPQDVLELQRRDHYIQLPPPGSNLSYYDHYAEGVLFKLSKKNRPVSMFSNNGNKESTGVWKERWVVLQGSRLLIYHKRKDVSKKTIDLPSPLNVLSRVLPQSSRQMFKFTPSATAMSSTMIAIDVSTDPMDPKLCFRGSSEHDINHWIRIFNSLNSNAAPLASPMPHTGPGSPMTAGSDMGSLSSAIASFSPERRRVQTTNTAFSNDAATVPSINPVLILNAAAAISNLHNMQSNFANTNNSNNSNGNHNHYRNLSHANHLQGVPSLDNKELNLLHHHPLNIAAKEDIRRRAITEPNRHRLMNAQQQRGHMKQSSKVSAPEIDTRAAGPVDVSNVSEAPFRLDSPPSRKRRPVLGTEYLDNASQVLLATSSARSSTAPVYSGYVWLYIPQATKPRENTSEDLQPNSSPDSPKLPSPGSPKSYASSSSKASGRYVKCFAAINDQGHFQWVEVKKQNDLGQEHDVKADIRSSSRSSYGIQLAPSQKQTQSPNCRPADGTALEDAEMAPHADSATTKKSRELIQASMSHKLRLFFFCIKISPSAIREVFIDMVPDTPSPSASPPAVVSPETTPTATPATSGAVKVANRVRHRLSSSLSTLTTAAKPPLPNVKSQSLSGSISKGKNATWPTMAPCHDKDASLHPGLSSNNRPMSHKASSSSLKSTLSNITTVPSPAWLQSKEGDGQLVQSPASAGSADPESPSSSTSSSSHVLSLAQGLQKAVRMTRSNSGSGSLDGPGRLPGYEGDAYISRSAGSSPNSSGTRPKMTLSEVMAAKQASIPDSAATLEQSKLLQQQIELQQGQQRADERLARSMAHNHSYQPLQEAVNLDPKPTSESIRATCPFLELNKDSDDMDSDEPMVTLKGYTETEEGWKVLQWALEKFLDGPIQDHNSALPPDDTLIPSYHSPPEIRLSEKANMFLSAKASLIEEANLAASMAAVDAVRSPTPDISMTRHDSGLPSTTLTYSSNSSAAISASSSSATTATSSTTTTNGTSSPSSNGPVAQIRATSVSLTRWMNLSGGGGDRDKNKVRGK